MSRKLAFTANSLDLAEAQRQDEAWIENIELRPTSRFMIINNSEVLLDGGLRSTRLAWLPYELIRELTGDPLRLFLGILGQSARFVADVSGLTGAKRLLECRDQRRFVEVREAALTMSEVEETGVLAQARSRVLWHQTRRFCSNCGGSTKPRQGGHIRTCCDCNTQHFPRTDPVAIALVHNEDRCLLGQSHGQMVDLNYYSALAGFVEQGETLERAVRREVFEEAGIRVGDVNYYSSQPWPFSSSLMIGCFARALSVDIAVNRIEMNDVRWFKRDEIRAALDGCNQTLNLPTEIAIGRHMIEAWVDAGVSR